MLVYKYFYELSDLGAGELRENYTSMQNKLIKIDAYLDNIGDMTDREGNYIQDVISLILDED